MDFKNILVQSGRRMLDKGLTVETWGNISVRDPQSGLIYLTPSAMPYNTISRDDVVVMRGDGSIEEGTRKPTVEAGMHLGIYRARKDVFAVIHTHPVDSTVFGVLHMPIPPIIDEAAQTIGGEVKVTQYALPGSEELAHNVVSALGASAACLIANHGAVCVGRDIDEAFKVCEVLEMTAKIYRMSLSVGRPSVISDENVAALRDFMVNHYGQDKKG
jgi:L-fuculose-phosphate aldolase